MSKRRSRTDRLSGLKVRLGRLRSDLARLQREITESTPPQFIEVEAPRRINVQTPYDRLTITKNDFSTLEEFFARGFVEFVDLHGPVNRERKYRVERDSVFRDFLREEAGKKLSIILPVASAGRKTTLMECLDSIERQTFYHAHRDKVELIVIQDGPVKSPGETVEGLRKRLAGIPNARLFFLNREQGRATARNIGIYYATGEIGFFIDSSMVLERNFLAEHMLRHARVSGIALVGFKENIKPKAYHKVRAQIIKGLRIPDYRADWKWCHKIGSGEPGFLWKNRYYGRGDNFYYMRATNFLRTMGGTDSVGNRSLPRFCHTGITSVPLYAVKGVGGFDESFDPRWGAEDTFLGALLLAWGIKIVPCPSALAFKIEHREPPDKGLDAVRNQAQCEDRLRKFPWSKYNFGQLEQCVEKLRSSGVLGGEQPR